MSKREFSSRHIVTHLQAKSVASIRNALSSHASGTCNLSTCDGNPLNHDEFTSVALTRYRDMSVQSGLLLIRGLPVEPVPSTPTVSGVKLSDDHCTQPLIHGVSAYLGSLLGYEAERGSSLIQDIYPLESDRALAVNSGAALFDFHTENAHHHIRPTYLGLLCLRPDRDYEAATLVSHVEDLCGLVDEATMEELCIAQYRTKFSLSFTRSGEVRIDSPAHPIIQGRGGALKIRHNSHNTYALTPGADAALGKLNEAAHRSGTSLRLAAGDLALIDNSVILHGRTSFNPRYDGHDRWLRRFYLFDGNLPMEYRSPLGPNIVGREPGG